MRLRQASLLSDTGDVGYVYHAAVVTALEFTQPAQPVHRLRRARGQSVAAP